MAPSTSPMTVADRDQPVEGTGPEQAEPGADQDARTQALPEQAQLEVDDVQVVADELGAVVGHGRRAAGDRDPERETAGLARLRADAKGDDVADLAARHEHIGRRGQGGNGGQVLGWLDIRVREAEGRAGRQGDRYARGRLNLPILVATSMPVMMGPLAPSTAKMNSSGTVLNRTLSPPEKSSKLCCRGVDEGHGSVTTPAV